MVENITDTSPQMTRVKATAPRLPKTPPPTPTNPKTKTKKAMLSPQTAAKVRRRAKSSPAKAKLFVAIIQKTYVCIAETLMYPFIGEMRTTSLAAPRYVPEVFFADYECRRKNQGIGLRSSASRPVTLNIPPKSIRTPTSRRRGMVHRRPPKRKALFSREGKLNIAQELSIRALCIHGVNRTKVWTKARTGGWLVDMYRIWTTSQKTIASLINNQVTRAAT